MRRRKHLAWSGATGVGSFKVYRQKVTSEEEEEEAVTGEDELEE
jgi:hypothetical protein